MFYILGINIITFQGVYTLLIINIHLQIIEHQYSQYMKIYSNLSGV